MTITKYNIQGKSQYGIVDDRTVLESMDDAASVKLGGKWHIPTYVEWRELIDCCSKKWTTYNGVKGILITGRNGKSIFLPAAGTKGKNGTIYDRGYNGEYWSSEMDSAIDGRPYNAHYVYLNHHEEFYLRLTGRAVGLSIRPVSK